WQRAPAVAYRPAVGRQPQPKNETQDSPQRRRVRGVFFTQDSPSLRPQFLCDAYPKICASRTNCCGIAVHSATDRGHHMIRVGFVIGGVLAPEEKRRGGVGLSYAPPANSNGNVAC